MNSSTSAPPPSKSEVFALHMRMNALRQLIPDKSFYFSNTDLVIRDGSAPPSDEEIDAVVAQLMNTKAMTALRAARDDALASTDWYVVKAMEEGKPIDPSVSTYRQKLRDLPTSLTQVPQLDGEGKLILSDDFPSM